MAVKARSGVRPQFELTHSRMARICCLADRLFISFKHGERLNHQLNAAYPSSEQAEVQFEGRGLLGAFDLRLLLGVVALAGLKGVELPLEPGNALEGTIRHKFPDAYSLIVKIQSAKLLREIGLSTGGGNIRLLNESLERLSKVNVSTPGFQRRQYPLLAVAVDPISRTTLVGLGPLLSLPLKQGSNYSRVDLHDVRELKSEPALLIHLRLCGYVDAGKMHRIGMAKLMTYAWPDDATGSALRRRRAKVLAALSELQSIGWTVHEYASHRYEITRPNYRTAGRAFLSKFRKTTI